MATTVIQNSAVAGAMGGLLAGRFVGSITALDYAGVANAARAIADQFIVQNAASAAPLADGDHPQLTEVVQAAAFAAAVNTGANSAVAGNYVAMGRQIYGASKQALTKLA